MCLLCEYIGYALCVWFTIAFATAVQQQWKSRKSFELLNSQNDEEKKHTHTTRIKNKIQLRFNQILATRPRLHCSNDRHIICCLKCYANMYTQNICCCCCSSNTTSCVYVVDGSFWSHWNLSNSFDFFPFCFWIPIIAFCVYLYHSTLKGSNGLSPSTANFWNE